MDCIHTQSGQDRSGGRKRLAAVGLFVVAVVTTLAGCDARQDGEQAVCADAVHAFLDRHQYRRAVVLYTECINEQELTASELASVYFQRGLARFSHGDPDTALVDLTLAIDAHPGGETHVGALGAGGHILGILGEYPEAIAAYDEAIDLDSTKAPLFLGRGLSYFAIGDFDRAQRDLEESQRLRPGRPFDAMWLYLARSRGGASDPEWLHELEQVALRHPGYAPIVDLFAGRKTPDTVLADETAPEDRLVRCDLLIYVAEHLILQGDHQRAVELLREAEEAGPDQCISVPVLQGELRRFSSAD